MWVQVCVCCIYVHERLSMQSSMLSLEDWESLCRSGRQCSFYRLSTARLNVFQFSPSDNSALSRRDKCWNIINDFATSHVLAPTLSSSHRLRALPFLCLIYLSLRFPCCSFFNMFLQVSYLVVLALANKESNSQYGTTCGSWEQFWIPLVPQDCYCIFSNETRIPLYVIVFWDILILFVLLSKTFELKDITETVIGQD